ncbi:nuclear transport factor 2 family protein [Streptomyces sp. NPDC006514]|uniref:nuclear transport factor 2 family protein n=1 Tax=unclassified Streptomyces TaxID=2593676 RepID=UPI0033A9C91A
MAHNRHETTPRSDANDTASQTPDASPNVQLIRAAYRAFQARDLQALLDTFAPDVHWVHPESMSAYGLGGTKYGHDGVQEFLARVPGILGGMQLEPHEFLESGDRVVVFGERRVTSVRGSTQLLKFVHSWTLRDGEVTVMEDIFDTVLLQQLIES